MITGVVCVLTRCKSSVRGCERWVVGVSVERVRGG
jgi:hypothetical protein